MPEAPTPKLRPVQALRPKTHLYWPPVLVVDLDSLVQATVTGQMPEDLRVSRPALDLIRLQKRFRGRVLPVSAMPKDQAEWISGVLGVEQRLCTVRDGEGPAARARAVAHMLDPRAYDLLGAPAFVSALGKTARRAWVMGADIALQRRMLTLGVTLYLLDDHDDVLVRDLLAVRAQGRSGSWDSETALGDTSIPPTDRRQVG